LVGWLVWLVGWLVWLVGLIGSFVAMRFIKDCNCQSKKKNLSWCRPPGCTEWKTQAGPNAAYDARAVLP
jgi:hypothetical protein